MFTVRLDHPADFEGWRTAARQAVQAGIDPAVIAWRVAQQAGDLLAGDTPLPPAPAEAAPLMAPRRFLELAQQVICHRDPERFGLLHAALARLQRDRGLIDDQADPLIDRLGEMAKAVRRDIHKMRAFVRFRELGDDQGPRFVAWFEPEHHIVRANAGFFVRRFAQLRWSILTPGESLHWDGARLAVGPGARRAEAPGGDPLEAAWKAYFAAIFNPARLKVGAMLSEMPKKYWANLPEAGLIPGLIASAQPRTQAMIEAGAAPTLERLRAEAARCTLCPLHGPATQTVFGEGPAGARLMLVGEQPGDQEDLAGRPFVGPAGQLLDRALAEAGIDRAQCYVTNAVKHFKFEARGRRRIHATPSAAEIETCRWWLGHELELVRPALVVMLGASAGRALMGRAVTVGRERGRPLPLPEGRTGWLTVHPSFLLRVEDPVRAEAERARFVADLREAA
ncbi:MAG: UdgX family uracil-DNA binding protein, partial [Sphingomonadaceae bacterium]